MKAALDLIDPLLAADDFQTAAKVLALARPLAVHDRSLAPVIQNHAQTIEAARAVHDRLAPYTEKLKTAPDDPPANLVIGSFLCFSKGDWKTGLPMLAKGSDLILKQLATLELSAPSKPDDLNRLADGWWDISAKEPAVSRSEIRRHAASFYKTALESATGLRRALLEHRIADAAADHAGPTQSGPRLSRNGADAFTNSIGMKFVPIKPGAFMMGSTYSEGARGDVETLHKVTITKAFLMAATAVTQVQWKTIMGNDRSQFKGDNHPADSITWDEAVLFCQKSAS